MRGMGHNIGFGPSRIWGNPDHSQHDETGMMGGDSLDRDLKCYNPAKVCLVVIRNPTHSPTQRPTLSLSSPTFSSGNRLGMNRITLRLT